VLPNCHQTATPISVASTMDRESQGADLPGNYADKPRFAQAGRPEENAWKCGIPAQIRRWNKTLPPPLNLQLRSPLVYCSEGCAALPEQGCSASAAKF
jgi:hypothetical protein